MLTMADHHGYPVHADGWIEQKRSPGHQLLPHEVKGGYLRVTLTIDGRRMGKLVHCVVAEAFIGPRPPGHEVNHKDGDKLNNAVSNLEYVTPSVNVRHSIDVLHTDRAPGEKNANAKLTDDLVRAIRLQRECGSTFAEIAAHHHIHLTTAHRVATRRTWRHVA